MCRFHSHITCSKSTIPERPRFGPLNPRSYPECNRAARCSHKVLTTTTQSPEHQLAVAVSGYALDALSQRNADTQRASHTAVSKHLDNTMPTLAPRAPTRPQAAWNAHSAASRTLCDLYRLLDPCHAREATQALRLRAWIDWRVSSMEAPILHVGAPQLPSEVRSADAEVIVADVACLVCH